MHVLDLLDHLDATGHTLRTQRGKLIVRPRADPATADAIRKHRDFLVAIIHGRQTGHAPAPCTICGQRSVSLVAILRSNGKPRETWPTCRMTPSCTAGPDADRYGRHIPRRADIDRTRVVRPPTTKAPPSRPPQRRLFGPWPAWPEAS